MPFVCSFLLNKPNATYIVGEIISGTIKLTTTSDKSVRGKTTIKKIRIAALQMSKFFNNPQLKVPKKFKIII